MQVERVKYVIWAADPKRAVQFYRNVFGAEIIRESDVISEISVGGATIGIGMGQVNRVDAARLAVERGGDRVRGAVAASDAFFPFPDGLETLAAAGVKAIVHPGGSVRDDEVTAAAAKAGVTLYLTGARHFAH